MGDRPRCRYWPLVTVSLVMVVHGVAGLVWDEDLSAPAARTGIRMGVVYGLNAFSGLLLLAVAGHTWWKRR